MASKCGNNWKTFSRPASNFPSSTVLSTPICSATPASRASSGCAFRLFGWPSNLGITSRRARQGVRGLVDIGALHLIERSNIGHVVDVRLPQQLCAAHSSQYAPACSMPSGGANLEQLDFWRTRPLRLAIHAREAGLCFYCLRQTPTRDHCLDHVVPVAKDGTNSYRNLVCCCMHCNSCKRDLSAPDFLRSPYREGELSRKELTARLAALRALAAGKLRPRFTTDEDSRSAPAKP